MCIPFSVRIFLTIALASLGQIWSNILEVFVDRFAFFKRQSYLLLALHTQSVVARSFGCIILGSILQALDL